MYRINGGAELQAQFMSFFFLFLGGFGKFSSLGNQI